MIYFSEVTVNLPNHTKIIKKISKSVQIQLKNGGNIGPVSVSDDVRVIWQEINYFQFVSNMLSYDQGI